MENAVSNEQPVSSDLIIGVGVGVGLCLLIALLMVILIVCLARGRKKEDHVEVESVPVSSGYYPVEASAESAPRSSEYASVVGSLNGSAQNTGVVPPGNNYAYGSISNSIVYGGMDVGNQVVYDNTLDLLKKEPPSPASSH